jgi:hypothetical protein
MIFAILAILSLMAFLVIRGAYIKYIITCWKEVCAIYVLENKETPNEFLLYTETWPFYTMLFNILIWDCKTFIVNQEELEKILDFFMEKGKVNQE